MTTTEPPTRPAARPDPAAPVNTTALRLARTPMDMAKAVLVLLVPVVIAVVVYTYFFGGGNVIAVDPGGAYSAARAAGHFSVLEPAGLPSGWQPISSAFSTVKDGSVLRVGYIAPDGSGIQLIESDRPAATLLTDELGATSAVATSVDLANLTWGQLDVAAGGHALVDTEQGRTVIVKGQADPADLRAFVTTLH